MKIINRFIESLGTAFFCVVFLISIQAQQRYVSPVGTDTRNDCTMSDFPCRTIQHAINVSGEGDTILASAGVYTEQIRIDKSINITGVGREKTIIQAADSLHSFSGRVITIKKELNEERVVLMSDLTIKNGNAAWSSFQRHGGGIYNEGELVLRRVILRDNTAEANGGGLYDIGSSRLKEVEFLENKAGGNGGGMFSDYGNSTVERCKFERNRVDILGNNQGIMGAGGGLYVQSNDSLTVRFTEFTENFAFHGGGMYSSACNVYSESNLFLGNTGVRGGGGVYHGMSTLAELIEKHDGSKLYSYGDRYENNTAEDGGGLVVKMTASFDNLLVKENEATEYWGSGGLLYHGDRSRYRTFVIKNSRFIKNYSLMTGALTMNNLNSFQNNHKIVMSNCLFEENTYYPDYIAPYGTLVEDGYGLFVSEVKDLLIIDCKFIEDGGIKTWRSLDDPFAVVNSTFYRCPRALLNWGDSDNYFHFLNCSFVAYHNDLGYTQIYDDRSSTAMKFENCIFYSDSTDYDGYVMRSRRGWVGPEVEILYTNIDTNAIQYLKWNGNYRPSYGEGVVNVNPMFISETDLQLSDNSPLINRGNPATDMTPFFVDEDGEYLDLAGNPRIVGDTIDMGAYENQTPAERKITKELSGLAVERLHPFPNPTRDRAEIELPAWARNRVIEIKVYSSSGKQVYAQTFMNKEENFLIDIADMSAGRYFISVRGGYQAATGKLLILR